MPCLHFCTHVSFHSISNVQIVRTFGNRIPIQTFEKWHNVSAWFLKPFGERVQENHIYHLVKPNLTVKTGAVYRGVTYVTNFFWKMEKLTFKSKI